LSRNELAFAGIPKNSSQYFSEIRKNKGVFVERLKQMDYPVQKKDF